MVVPNFARWRHGDWSNNPEALQRVRGLGAGVVAVGAAIVLTLAAFLPPPPYDEAPAAPSTLAALKAEMARSGLDVSALRTGTVAVPRVSVERLPHDWRKGIRADRRKKTFIAVVLPLVLQANEKILDDRRRLHHAMDRLRRGQTLAGAEGSWLRTLALRYEVRPETLNLARDGFARLLRRVDVIPPSLALAQAAMESGWGSSRFAIEGNALFGEWTEESENTIVPAGREAGRSYAIRAFETLQGSIESYMRNLNSHRAYRKFRQVRAARRAKGEPLLGSTLAPLLRSYSAQGSKYIAAIRSIIAKNELEVFDRVELAEQAPDASG